MRENLEFQKNTEPSFLVNFCDWDSDTVCLGKHVF